MKNYSIIVLPLARWEEYRTLRLEALQVEPYAFGKSYEEEVENSSEVWQNKLTQNSDLGFYLFAESGGKLIGMIGCDYETKLKIRHIATLKAYYVSINARSQGIGRVLLEVSLKRIKKIQKIHKIRLSVNVLQTKAIALYKKFGFEQVGYFKDELFVEGKYLDQIMMEKFL